MTDKSKQIVTTDGTIRDIEEYVAEMQEYESLTDEEIIAMAEEDRRKRESWEIIVSEGSWYVK